MIYQNILIYRIVKCYEIVIDIDLALINAYFDTKMLLKRYNALSSFQTPQTNLFRHKINANESLIYYFS